MLMHHNQLYTKSQVVETKELATVTHVCGNPLCEKRAVAQETTSGTWLCQSCLDFLYDALWGLGT